MLQSYLILSLEAFDEDWIRRLPNQDNRRLLVSSVLDFEFNLETLNVLTWVRDRWERTQQRSLSQHVPDGSQRAHWHRYRGLGLEHAPAQMP